MPDKKKALPVRHIAVRELRYPHAETGEEIHISPGESVHDLAELSLKLELKAGNVKAQDEELIEAQHPQSQEKP
jgi:hypothetical protein